MLGKILLTGVAVALLAPGAALAQTTQTTEAPAMPTPSASSWDGYTGTYAGQYAADRPLAQNMQRLALGFWRARWKGQPLPCDDGKAVRFYYAPGLDGADGRGGDCTAWIEVGVHHEALEDLSHGSHWGLRFECGDWVHEIAHAFGIPHDHSGGVMDVEDNDGTPLVDPVPFECKRFAKTTVQAALAKRARKTKKI